MNLQLASAGSQVSAAWALLSRMESIRTTQFHGTIQAGVATDRSPTEPADTPRTFVAVTELIAQVERSVMADANGMARLIGDIKRAIQTESDPLVLIGVLLEGIVQTTLERLSVRDRRDMVRALSALLMERITSCRSEPD